MQHLMNYIEPIVHRNHTKTESVQDNSPSCFLCNGTKSLPIVYIIMTLDTVINSYITHVNKTICYIIGGIQKPKIHLSLKQSLT